jgi:DNA-binding Lrp family transcriptional regulator
MRTVSESASDFLSKISPFVRSDGARNLNEISRELSIPYQTLRKRMVNLKKEGISILAIPDFEKLGLERFRVFFRLQKSTSNSVKAFFGGLHQSSGLKIYSRSMYSQIFDCEFAIPRGTFSELEKLLHKLEEMELITDVESTRIKWKEVLMLNGKLYDYSKKEWDVDFSTLSGNPSSVEIPEVSKPERVDFSDLLMIKELEADPWIKVVELAKKVNLEGGDTAYHLNNHIFHKKLIKSFRLKWNGTKEAWLKHSIVNLTYLFKRVPEEDIRHAMSIFTSSPFTWSHSVTEDGSYLAEVMLPVSQYSEATQYFSTQLRLTDLRPLSIFEEDWSCASTFTIPYMLYNKEKSAWDFNSEHALEYTLQMIKSYSS